jgi:hypothetical protein
MGVISQNPKSPNQEGMESDSDYEDSDYEVEAAPTHNNNNQDTDSDNDAMDNNNNNTVDNNIISAAEAKHDDAFVTKKFHGKEIRLPEVAQHTVPADFNAVTRDHEDHTFCGIMFTVQAKDTFSIPVQFLEIQSVAVRGELGDVSVYYSWGGYHNKHCSPKEWIEVYRNFHDASPQDLCELELSHPIRLFPGQQVGLYVHSRAHGDEAIVYGEKHAEVTHEDAVMKLLPGIAHTGNVPFSRHGMWGYNGWRSPRQFVGKINYGVKYFLWRPVPTLHANFPRGFRRFVQTLLLCHKSQHGTLRLVAKDILFYIINFCAFDWAGEIEEDERNVDEDGLREIPIRRHNWW